MKSSCTSPRSPLPTLLPESHVPVTGVRKIAVLRANLLGDLVVSLPALDALRAAYPEAEIVLLAREWHRQLLEGRPGAVDRVVVVPEIAGLREDPRPGASADALDDFYRSMQAEQFDIALQMHGGGKSSNSVVGRLGAAVTAGSRTPDAPALDRWIPYDRNQLEILRYLEVVSLVGAQPTTLVPHFAVTQPDVVESERVFPAVEGPLVALHPGARHPERRWPAERFGAVGDALAAAGADVVVTGADNESHIVRRVLDAMRHPGTDLSGRLSLGGLSGLYSRCRVVVANDTGPLHLAGAVGAATVGIYWGYNLVAYGPLFRTRHRVAVSWRGERRRCRPKCNDSLCERCEPFVADIEMEQVRDEALALFEAARDLREGRTPAPIAVHGIA